FNDSRSSLPPPNFKIILENINDAKFKELIQYILNDPVKFSKFGSEILESAIKENNNFVAQSVFDKLTEFIKIDSHNIYNMKKLLFLISEKLPELCNHHSNFLITKYILHTSILLAPFCSSIDDFSKNTSLYSYSLGILKKSTIYKLFNNNIFVYFINFINRNYYIYFKTHEYVPTITFVVPF